MVTNPLSSPVHVVLNPSVEGLTCRGPCSQVVPAGGSAKFLLQLHCHDTQHLKEHIQCVVNGCHFQVREQPGYEFVCHTMVHMISLRRPVGRCGAK